MDKEVVHLFLQVLLVCDQQNLIGKEMFAIDGCKLPSNASKAWSGTRADLKRKAAKMEKAIHRMVMRHKCMDESKAEPEILEKEEKYIEQLKETALSGGNLFEELLHTVRYCSFGQITNALFEVGGQYRRNM